MCPKWATEKKECKCGIYYYPSLIGSSMKITDVCSICDPDQYKERKKKK